MKKLRLLFLLAASASVFSACKKDDDPVLTKTDFLTAKVWKTTALTINPRLPADSSGSNFLPADLFAYYASNGGACFNDDIKKFNKSFTYQYEEGETKCNPDDDTVFETGSWTLSSDESVLALTATGESFPTNYTLVELKANSLIYTRTLYRRTNSRSPFVKYTLTETLSNQ